MPRLLICVLLLALSAFLGGCATVQAWRKCGAGCPGDAALAAAVRAQFAGHGEFLAPNEVEVRVLDGVVYLRGLVATDLQRDTAEDLARSAPGAPRVVDMLAIEYSGR